MVTLIRHSAQRAECLILLLAFLYIKSKNKGGDQAFIKFDFKICNQIHHSGGEKMKPIYKPATTSRGAEYYEP
ncbi:hypothetical protein DCC85_15950 [Paenibacillus sp. CAA11]|nr:hypothetical protein DCC85_15950 [Paenibacillus sp. CAA11]